jgi:hypothetical protein
MDLTVTEISRYAETYIQNCIVIKGGSRIEYVTREEIYLFLELIVLLEIPQKPTI